uniref:Peptidase S1 domain-containing protein n=1 Tax=Cuerna arida TaxID=1464854 RepID=A0A1B6EQ65_9HEMI
MVLKISVGLLLTVCFVTDAFYLYRYQDDVTEHPNWPLLDLKDICGRSATLRTKTIGGHNADMAEYPWMAQLIYRQLKDNSDVGGCGGSVINKRYVLTAAHCCVTGYGSKLSHVKLGEYDIHRTKDCLRGRCSPPPLEIDIEEIVMHYKYDQGSFTLKNDICLLRLSEDIEFSDYVKPICLPTSKDLMERSFVGSTLTVVGWGLLEQEPEPRNTDVLQEVRVRVQPDKSCPHEITEEFQESSHICAGNAQTRDACVGDSGGPLMYTAVEGGVPRHYLVGLVSNGPLCSHENRAYSPGMYTKVSKYIGWILDIIHE